MKTFLVCVFALSLFGCATSFERDGFKYQYVLKAVSWSEAKQLAENAGGRLAVFDTPEALSRVESRLPSGKIFWVGLSDAENEGVWRWLDGTPFNTAIAGSLFGGPNKEVRDYGYILLQGGIGARANTGELPRGAHGRKQVDGFLIQYK